MRLLFVFCLGLLFFSVPSIVAAQEIVPVKKEQQDSLAFVQEFPGKFNLRLILRERPMFLQLHNGDNRVEYRPNTRPSIGLGFNILRVGLSFSVKMPPADFNVRTSRGNTDFRDYQLSVFVKHFLIDMIYQDFSGFYMSNTSEWDDRFQFSDLPYRDDITIRRATVNSIYLFNVDQLTLRIYNNSLKQLRGAGSFLIMSSLNHFRIGSNHMLLPQDLMQYYSDDAYLSDGQFTGLSMMPGYSHNFIVENFYMNLTVAAGPDFQYREYQINGGSHANWQLQGKINIRGAVGYDNDKFFAGIHFVDQRNRYKTGGLDIVHNTGVMRLSVGHRFAETGWMKSIRNWGFYRTVMKYL